MKTLNFSSSYLKLLWQNHSFSSPTLWQLYRGCRKTQPPLKRSDFRLKTADLKRGLKAPGRLVLLRCSWSIHTLFYVFASLLKSSILSHSSSFSGSYFTEKIEALWRIQIPLTTSIQFLCTHLGYSCQVHRLEVGRLWPGGQIQLTARFCTACR